MKNVYLNIISIFPYVNERIYIKPNQGKKKERNEKEGEKKTIYFLKTIISCQV